MLDINQVKELVPLNHRSNITQEFVDLLNDCDGDGELAHVFRENFASYSNVLQTGKFKLTSYLEAVKFVSYKMLGKSSVEAWKLTYPDRYERISAKGVVDFSPYASAVNSNKLVTQITQQSLVPLYVLNNHMGQEALNELYQVMKNPRTKDRDRINACVAVLDAVKQPEDAKLNIAIDFKGDELLSGINKSLEQLATTQLNMLNSGKMTAIEIMDAQIIDVEPL